MTDERLQIWLRLIVGLTFLGYFCFWHPEELRSLQVTGILLALIFGPTILKIWRSGGGSDE